jgi:hypothetical protein
MRSLAAEALLCERPEALRQLLDAELADTGLERLLSATGSGRRYGHREPLPATAE